MSDSARMPKRRLRRRPRGHPITLARRALAVALFAASAVLFAVPGAGSEPSGPVLVTARDLPMGVSLRPADVRIVYLADDLRPSGALTRPAQVRGRRLIGAARAGEPLTDTRLMSARTGPRGTVAVPLRLGDPGVTELLRPGTRVALVAQDEDRTRTARDGPEVLSADATVLTVLGADPAPPGGTASPGIGSVSGESRSLGDGADPLVLVAVPEDQAADVAAASLGRPVTVTLR